MNRDLERQMDELGPEYRALVRRMVSVCRLPSGEVPSERKSVERLVGWSVGLLTAASLLAFLGLAFVFRSEGTKRVYTVRASDPAFECLQATARNDMRLQEFLRTNVAEKGCSPERRFGIITPLEFTWLANPPDKGQRSTEEE